VTIELNHTIVPSRDKEKAAKFISHIFGFSYEGLKSHFAAVKVNENLTLDFDNKTNFERHHYAFKVSEIDFDKIFSRIKGEGVIFGSLPRSTDDMKINNRRGGRGLYFCDFDGHSWEMLTK